MRAGIANSMQRWEAKLPCAAMCVRQTFDSKFCQRTGIARSEGRGQGQRNKLCLAVSGGSVLSPSIQKVRTKLKKLFDCDMLLTAVFADAPYRMLHEMLNRAEAAFITLMELIHRI